LKNSKKVRADITTLTTTNYDSYNSIQFRLKTLNDITLPRLLGRKVTVISEHNKANAGKSEPCEPDLNLCDRLINYNLATGNNSKVDATQRMLRDVDQENAPPCE